MEYPLLYYSDAGGKEGRRAGLCSSLVGAQATYIYLEYIHQIYSYHGLEAFSNVMERNRLLQRRPAPTI